MPSSSTRFIRLRCGLVAILATGLIPGLRLGAQNTTYTDGQPASTTPLDTTGDITLTLDTGAATQSGDITGAGALIKAGAGTLTLSGANSYSGGTTISGGVLAIASADNLGSGQLTFSAGATLQTTNTGAITLAPSLSLSGLGTVEVTSATGNTTLSGTIFGSGTLNKSGSGTLILTGNSASTYSGAVTVSAGTLAFGSSQVFGNAVAIDVAQGATWKLGANTRVGGLTGSGTIALGGSTLNYRAGFGDTFAGNFSSTPGGTLTVGSGNLTLTGTAPVSASLSVGAGVGGASSTLVLAGGATYSGPVSVGVGGAGGPDSLIISNATVNSSGFQIYSGGAVNIGANGTSGTVTSDITLNGGNVTFFRSDDYTYSKAISGSGIIYKIGGATLTLLGSNALFTSPKLYIYGGNVSVGNGGTTGSLGMADTSFFASGVGLVFNRSDTVTYSGNITGGNVTQAGTGNLTLGGTLSSVSNSTVSAGTLKLSGSASLAAVKLTVEGNGTFDLNGAARTVSSLSGAGNVALGSSTLTTGNTSATTFSGTLAGTGGLTKQGSGNFTLSGTNSYTGATTINAGTLTLGSATALGDTAISVGSSGQLNLNGNSITLGNVSGAGTIALGSGTLSTGTATTTISGVISGSGGLTKSGAGTLTLSGVNTYGGVTTISAGILQLGSGALAGGLGAGEIVNDATLAVSSTANLTLGNKISGSGALSKSGSGTLALGGDNSFSGGVTVSGGDLSLSRDTALGTGAVSLSTTTVTNTAAVTLANAITLNAGATFATTGGNATLAGNLGGAGSLTKTGADTLFLTGTNNYTGGTTLSAGRLVGGSANFTGNITNNAELIFDQSYIGTFGGAISGTGSVTKTGTGTLTLSGNNNFSGGLSLNAGTLTLGSSGSLGTGSVYVAASATLDLGSASLDFTRFSGSGQVSGSAQFSYSSAADFTLGNQLSGTASLALSGAGTLTLTAANGYSGGSTLTGGTIALGHNSALGTGAVALNGSTLLASGGARTLANAITLNGDTTIAGTSAITFTGPLTLARNRELTVSNTALTTISGIIDQSGGGRTLAKYGSGTLELTGANTYTGGTYIGAGTVRINNSSGSAFGTGAVTVDSGAKLTGAGSFTGAFQNNGTYSPGNSPTLATHTSFSQGAMGTLEMELAGLLRGTQYDAMDVTGALTFGGTLKVTLLDGFMPSAGNTFDFFNAATSTGTFATINLPALSPGLAWNTTALYSTGELSVVSAIPEPSTYAALAGACGLALAVYRRRRRE